MELATAFLKKHTGAAFKAGGAWIYDNEVDRVEGDPADGDIVALEGQPGTVSFRATDSLYYSSVLWDFGDGTTSTDLYATHYYSEPGTYTASLTVYNNHGSDVTTYMIEVPSADPGDDGTEWALVAAVVLIAFISGALIARRLL